MSEPAALECLDVGKRFGPVQALDHLTMTLDAPATGLLGANGAGKSTLLRTALGLSRPDAGTLKVLGLDLPLYTSALPEADEEYRRTYLSFVEHLVRDLPGDRRRALPPTLRLYLELAEAGDHGVDLAAAGDDLGAGVGHGSERLVRTLAGRVGLAADDHRRGGEAGDCDQRGRRTGEAVHGRLR